MQFAELGCMPLISICRFIFAFLSWVVFAVAIWLLWRWYDHNVYWTVDDQLHVLSNPEWREFVALGLLALSFSGRFFWPLVIARPDTVPSSAAYGEGSFIVGAHNNQIYVESLGRAEGPALLLTHGWGLDSTIWNYAKRTLELTHRVIVWDLPGLGKSASDEVSLDAFADNLAAVIRYAGAPVVLVGHSIGGMIIQTLAKRQPELFGSVVEKVILLNTTYTNPLKTMILPRLSTGLQPLLELMFRLEIWLLPLAWLSSWQSYLSGSAHFANRVAFGPRVTRSQLNHVALLGTRNSPATLAKGNLAMFHWDASNALNETPVPVLVLGGEIDIVTKEEAGRVISASAPQGRSQTVRAANHMGFLELSAAYHLVIQAFTESPRA
jgi:pimeloyl-ACP methyl ester carboxylesterase